MEGKVEGKRKKCEVPMGNASRSMLEPLYGEEKMMAAQDKADKRKNEISCQRCNGRMAFEKFYGENGSFFGWHCVMCGDILDSVILLHRLSHDSALAIPEKEEERMSLVRKYINASSKLIKVQNKDNLAVEHRRYADRE